MVLWWVSGAALPGRDAQGGFPGLAFAQLWLVLVGMATVLFMVGGLLFEYHLGGRKSLR